MGKLIADTNVASLVIYWLENTFLRFIQVITFCIFIPCLFVSVFVEGFTRGLCVIILSPIIYIVSGKYYDFIRDIDDFILQRLIGSILDYAVKLTK